MTSSLSFPSFSAAWSPVYPYSEFLSELSARDEHISRLEKELSLARQSLEESLRRNLLLTQENTGLKEHVSRLDEHVERQTQAFEDLQYGRFFQCVSCHIGMDDMDENAVHICNCEGAVSLCRPCFFANPRSQQPLHKCQDCQLNICDSCHGNHPNQCWECASRSHPLNMDELRQLAESWGFSSSETSSHLDESTDSSF